MGVRLKGKRHDARRSAGTVSELEPESLK